MKVQITNVVAYDVRFPTSLELDGSDAMHPDPDYSAAYVVLQTNVPGLNGHGMTFTIGRGNELCVAGIQSLKYLVVGKQMSEITSDMGRFWKHMTNDSQLRWLGPDKGVIHLATAAIINAVWDLWCRIEKKPLWQLVADMSPEELVRCVDFSFITDAITPKEAIQMLKEIAPGKKERIANLKKKGYPAYVTSAGWLGYSEEKLRRLCREAVNDGWTHLKFKVGSDLQDDIRRLTIAREELGDKRFLMIDANQKWDVDQAIEWLKPLAKFDPWWIEEPTSPDDILGHAKIRKAMKPMQVATGEHCQNRVIFKQLMQAEAIDFCQLDSCRLGGVNEVLAVLLMAAKFNIPVCPHAGGIGLCEYVQHLSMIDYICVSGSLENRVVEYAGHLVQHFKNAAVVKNGHYQVPETPGYGIEMLEQSLIDYQFPTGKIWKK